MFSVHLFQRKKNYKLFWYFYSFGYGNKLVDILCLQFIYFRLILSQNYKYSFLKLSDLFYYWPSRGPFPVASIAYPNKMSRPCTHVAIFSSLAMPTMIWQGEVKPQPLLLFRSDSNYVSKGHVKTNSLCIHFNFVLKICLLFFIVSASDLIDVLSN